MTSPTFTPPHKNQSTGVDPLGLREINLTMMDTMLPGINNVVVMVRPFSLMCWVVWHHEIAVAQQQEVSTARFRSFKEKVEALFLFTHVRAGDASGLPGAQQKSPGTERLTFTFEKVKRTVSLLDAVQYGPALKNLNGLGFLNAAGENSIPKVTPAGQELALELNESLLTHLSEKQYAFLSSLDENEVEASLIDDNFYAAWSVSRPSDAERQTFSSRIFQPQMIGRSLSHARRSTMLGYVMELLNESPGPLTANALRRKIVLEFPTSLVGHEHEGIFRIAQRYWQLLQVRQAQRLALECMLSWLEGCLMHMDLVSVEEMVEFTVPKLELDACPTGDAGFLKFKLNEYLSGASLNELLDAGVAQPETLDIMRAGSALQELVAKHPFDDKVPARAFSLALQCAVYGEAFKAEDVTRKLVSEGPPHRIPLGLWSSFVYKHKDQSASWLFHKILERYVVAQHLGIAASRSRDEKNRMRFSPEDQGLITLLPTTTSILRPSMTPDRLGSALSLLKDCGLICAQPQLKRDADSALYTANESRADVDATALPKAEPEVIA